jgi:hypothetical protein
MWTDITVLCACLLEQNGKILLTVSTCLHIYFFTWENWWFLVSRHASGFLIGTLFVCVWESVCLCVCVCPRAHTHIQTCGFSTPNCLGKLIHSVAYISHDTYTYHMKSHLMIDHIPYDTLHTIWQITYNMIPIHTTRYLYIPYEYYIPYDTCMYIMTATWNVYIHHDCNMARVHSSSQHHFMYKLIIAATFCLNNPRSYHLTCTK